MQVSGLKMQPLSAGWPTLGLITAFFNEFFWNRQVILAAFFTGGLTMAREETMQPWPSCSAPSKLQNILNKQN